jgi:hypothetical protein
MECFREVHGGSPIVSQVCLRDNGFNKVREKGTSGSPPVDRRWRAGLHLRDCAGGLLRPTRLQPLVPRQQRLGGAVHVVPRVESA